MTEPNLQNGGTATTPPTDQNPQGGTALPTGPDGTPFDPNRAMELINKLREEGKSANDEIRKLKADLEARQAELRQANESDAERQERERAEAEAKAAQAAEQVSKATETLRKGLLLAELAKPQYGIVDAQAAAALITGVQYAEDGTPSNLTTPGEDGKTLMDRFLEQRPFLKHTPPTPGVPVVNGGAGANQPPGPSLTAAEIKAAEQLGMTPERYAAMRNVSSINDYEALQKAQ